MNGNRRELRILTLSVVPTVLLLNYLMFGQRYLSSLTFFAITTVLLLSVCSLVHLSYSRIMKMFRIRFPHQQQAGRRILIIIAIFVISSGLALSVLFKVYDVTGFMGFKATDAALVQCYAVVIVINAFMLFVYETMANFDNYVQNVKITEELKKEYLESQLLGLKSQMNPHFLFNSLNTLSSLITDETDDAEIFLDHMSKVFRYLLRNNDEKMVQLHQELSFLQSYTYLLKARHKEALIIEVDVEAGNLNAQIPPLTLQMIVENTVTYNTLSRDVPLCIRVYTWNNVLMITNNQQPKHMLAGPDTKSLTNIINKFRLLWSAEVSVTETGKERQVCIPLIHQNVLVS